MTPWDIAQGIVGMIVLTALVGLMVAKQVARTLPFFVVYQSISLPMDVILLIVATCYSSVYLDFLIVCFILDVLLYLCVMFEIAGSVLRFNRQLRSSRRYALFPFAAACLLFWSLAQWPHPLFHENLLLLICLRIFQAAQIVQLAALMALIGWSNLQKLRWPERELRIVTGMGFWALVGYGVLIACSSGLYDRPGYGWITRLVPASCTLATAYLVHYFWTEPGSAAETVTPTTAVKVLAGHAGKSGDRDDAPLQEAHLPI